jgi:CheY-like chemotaxis protein
MSKKVLIIDDDRDVAKVASLWVESAGYGSQTAYDGDSGLAAAQEYRPDVVLLDIMMPGIDGFEVSRRLKSNSELAHIPVIFLSAKVQDTARREASSAGAKYFLPKPYEGADLIEAISTALNPPIAQA